MTNRHFVFDPKFVVADKGILALAYFSGSDQRRFLGEGVGRGRLSSDLVLTRNVEVTQQRKGSASAIRCSYGIMAIFERSLKSER